MNHHPDWLPELKHLLDCLQDGGFIEQDRRRLNELLRYGADERRYFVMYMDVHSGLYWEGTPETRTSAFRSFGDELRGGGGNDECKLMSDELSANVSDDAVHSSSSILYPLAPSAIAPVVLESSPVLYRSLFTLQSPVGSFLFSYSVAALLLGIGMLVGLAWRISSDRQVVRGPSGQVQVVEKPAPNVELVGRITGMADCRWTDSAMAAAEYDEVPLGQKYALASGFLEITYDTGARVIIQGPCTYEVESSRGGFLSFGKLTARVENRWPGVRGQGSEVKGERTANLALAQNETQPTTSLAPRSLSVSPIYSPLFSVRTPTAIVTDRGTEFGVEVDRTGTSRAHVFQGRVDLQPIDGGRGGAVAIQLAANETARVERTKNRTVAVIREPGQPAAFASRFLRTLKGPKPAPIKLFSTGMGLKEGDPDPHWQVVARSDDPHFKVQAAVVMATGRGQLPNNAAQSQWVSIGNRPPALPDGVTFTFRTTFEVGSLDLPPDAVVLRGWFMVNKNNTVAAMRVNGRGWRGNGAAKPTNVLLYRISVPKKHCVEGSNSLEIEVASGNPSGKVDAAQILLRVWGEQPPPDIVALITPQSRSALERKRLERWGL